MNKNFELKKVLFGMVVLDLAVFIFSNWVLCGNLYAAESQDAGKEISKLEKIKKAGKLVVGTSADYPPYEFHLLDQKESELVGIDIDIARAIASELGVKLEVRDLIFSRLFDTLNAGKIDIAIAGLHPTESRKEIAAFSDTYYQAIQSVVILNENSEKIKTVEDLRGKHVGVQKESIQENLARTQIPGAEFDVRETIEELVIILDKGLIDAIILEEPVAQSYVNQNKKFLAIQCLGFADKLGSAIAVKKGDTLLLNEINRILANLKQDEKIKEFVENAKVLTNKK